MKKSASLGINKTELIRVVHEHRLLSLVCGVLVVLVVFQGLYNVGLYPYLIGFILGCIWTAVTLPAFLGIIYWIILKPAREENTQTDTTSEGLIQLSAELAQSLTDHTGAPIHIEDKETKAYGIVLIQFAGKTHARRNCFGIIKGNTLYFKYLGSSDKSTKEIDLVGCFIRRKTDINLSEQGQKGLCKLPHFIEIFHGKRTVLYKVDYIYLIFEAKETMERWYYTLLSCQSCNPVMNLYINKLDLDPSYEYFNSYLKYLSENCKNELGTTSFPKENGIFLNLLLSRMFVHIKDSVSIRKNLVDYMSIRLSEKIEEKNLQERMNSIVITSIQLGNFPPQISDIIVAFPSDPLQNPDLQIDFNLSYENGEASMGLKTVISVSKLSSPVQIKVQLKSLKGQMRLVSHPYPFSKFAFSFLTCPEMELNVDVSIGLSGLGALKNKVSSMIKKKLQEMIKEKFVLPNRKYVRMPGVQKQDIQRTETTFKVFSEVEMEVGDMNPSPNIEISAPPRSPETIRTDPPPELPPRRPTNLTVEEEGTEGKKKSLSERIKGRVRKSGNENEILSESTEESQLPPIQRTYSSNEEEVKKPSKKDIIKNKLFH